MSGFGYIASIESIAQNQFSGDEDYRSACGSAIIRL